MTATITDIRAARAKRRRSISLEGLARLAAEIGAAWAHVCPELRIHGAPVEIAVLSGQPCPYCGALDHGGPKGAA